MEYRSVAPYGPAEPGSAGSGRKPARKADKAGPGGAVQCWFKGGSSPSALPRDPCQWPEDAFAEMEERLGLKLNGAPASQAEMQQAEAEAEEEVRAMVRLGLLDPWAEVVP